MSYSSTLGLQVGGGSGTEPGLSFVVAAYSNEVSHEPMDSLPLCRDHQESPVQGMQELEASNERTIPSQYPKTRFRFNPARLAWRKRERETLLLFLARASAELARGRGPKVEELPVVHLLFPGRVPQVGRLGLRPVCETLSA